MNRIHIGFKKLSDAATIPTRAHETDSGFDLYAAEDVYIEPGETRIISTNIAVNLPAGYEAQVRPRSGITAKTRLRVQLGTIDNDYTGDIGIIVDYLHASDIDRNTDDIYNVHVGDRIAQLVVQHLPTSVAYEIIDDIGDTDRGTKGFGSTGVRDVSTEEDVCRICRGTGVLEYVNGLFADEKCYACAGVGRGKAGD